MITPFRFEEEGLSPRYPGKLFTKDEVRGEGVRPHYHSSVELNILQDIRGSIRIGGREYALQGRRALLIPPGMVHSYEILPGSGEIHILHIAHRMMERLIRPEEVEVLLGKGCSPWPPRGTGGEETEENAMEAAVADRLAVYTRMKEKPVYIPPLPAGELLFFLLPCFQREDHPGQGRSFISGEEERRRLRRIIDYAEHHYGEPVSLEKAAGICGISRSSFCRFFQAATGSSWGRYLTDLRLDCALQMLQRGTSVTMAAMECGFYDSSHFSRHFKSRFGIPPGRVKG